MLATLVIKNGTIHTLDRDGQRPSAIALIDNKILALGDDEEMLALLRPGGKVVDLGKRCLTPGLVDAHVHFRSLALQMNRIELIGLTDLEEVLTRIKSAAENKQRDEWILGRGWNQANWQKPLFPNKGDLDLILPHQPALLRHKSGHAAWVNSKAMCIAGLVSGRPDPPGGKIQRDLNGEPTGILFEEAIKLVSVHVPKPGEAELTAAMRDAQQHCLEAGLTGLHDFDGRSCFLVLQTLHRNEELKIRVVKNIPVTRLDHAIGVGLRSGFGDDWLRIGGIKMFADGALGPRTASMIDPYEGEPENLGIIVTDKEEMMARAVQASANGLSVTVHAIGDRANHDVLDVLETVRKLEKENDDYHSWQAAHLRPPQASLMHRIEHAQLLHLDDIHRFGELNVVASMQPVHATADMEMADRYWGERAELGYAWQKLLNTGAILAFGSDAPVDPVEPLTGIYAAVTRRRPDGMPGLYGWYPEQRLTVEQAIRAYTIGPAKTSGRENQLGSISPGNLADFTIFDRDLFSVPKDELLEVRIDGTIVDGRFMYRAW